MKEIGVIKLCLFVKNLNNNIMSKIEEMQEYNYKILDLLRVEIEKNPHLRFGQILCNTNILQYSDKQENGLLIKDIFYDEPIDIYNRMKVYVTLYK